MVVHLSRVEPAECVRPPTDGAEVAPARRRLQLTTGILIDRFRWELIGGGRGGLTGSTIHLNAGSIRSGGSPQFELNFNVKLVELELIRRVIGVRLPSFATR